MNRILYSLVAAAFAVSALAAEGQGGKAKAAGATAQDAWTELFRKADTDGSGGLSKAELARTDARILRGIKKNFDPMDTNKDGQVTIAERNAFLDSGKAAKKQKGAGR